MMHEPNAINIAVVLNDDRIIDDIVAGRTLPPDDRAAASLAQLHAALHEACAVPVTAPPPAVLTPPETPQRRLVRHHRLASAAAVAGVVAACAVVGATIRADHRSTPVNVRPASSGPSITANAATVQASSLIDAAARRLTAPLSADQASALDQMLDRAEALLPAAGQLAEHARIAALRVRVASLKSAPDAPPASSAPASRSASGPGLGSRGRSDGTADGNSGTKRSEDQSDGSRTGGADERGDDTTSGQQGSGSDDQDGSRAGTDAPDSESSGPSGTRKTSGGDGSDDDGSGGDEGSDGDD